MRHKLHDNLFNKMIQDISTSTVKKKKIKKRDKKRCHHVLSNHHDKTLKKYYLNKFETNVTFAFRVEK